MATPLWAHAAQTLDGETVACRTDFQNVTHLKDPRILGSLIALSIEQLRHEHDVDLSTLVVTVEPENASFHRITTAAALKEN